ncbi:efflux RND transporter periplasmic adaptor subunit [Enterobacter bugandensis]|nr:efflux RND transporter periplasmic adaptor subunit [Enterobacter bugandensis]MCK6730751.1 efflux RND transporter periplasmic adaptor subunit [Enterobacter bugandensis]MCK6811498.1 efflux RND transporter periplasmic adaptor subunit [Enterobacter bugandensis]MCK7197257.1 efflux RND transporter periplasmic adaptor subunit [Enterobacter bugandensis]MCK7207396.1 efflux RND transporter periplasmic adaptor subunit [Enterobacter bugandensis]MDK7611476.1 efflux RND transporter periplasmic adaptor su
MTCAAALLIIFSIALFFFLRSPEVPEYVTAPVRIGDIENAVLATGRIDAIERVNVGAQVSGQVKSLKVKLGDRVTKGQLIAEIDDVPQRNDLRNAEAALNVVKADLQAKQAQLKQASLRFKRQRQMLNEDASSREDFETAETTLASTRAELSALNAKLVQAQIDVDKKKVDLGYTKVVAPMDGIVIAVVTQQGQTVNSSQSAPTIIKLACLDVMTIKAQISEADIMRISPGQKARFTIFSEPDKHYDATLRTVELAPESVMKDDSLASSSSASGSGTSNASVYYNALLDVPNPENRLRIAMTAQVTLLAGEAKNTLLVPIQAVHKVSGNKQQVQILTSDNRLETREVKTGITNSVDIQILDGVKVGEHVVLSQPGEKAPGEGFVS